MNFKKLIKIIFSVITFSLLAIAIYLVGANIYATKNHTLASFFGYSLSYVPTESMEPTIEAKSTIIISKSNFEDAKENDIIVYFNSDNNIYVIHRIKKITDKGFIMQGDNNSSIDIHNDGSTYYVTKDNFYGKYVRTLNIFNLRKLGDGKVLFVIIIAFGVIMISIEGFSFFKTFKESKKNTKNEEIIIDDEFRKKLKEEIKKELMDKKGRSE